MTQLRSFRLPAAIDGTRVDVEMGKRMILAWRLDLRFRVELPVAQERRLAAAAAITRRLFAMSAGRKARCTSDLGYSGHVGRPSMHYGSHFTITFMRRYPEHPTTWRILAERRLTVLGHFKGLRRAA